MKLRINSCDGIYNNSLDVRFTKKCDNRCSFCIENDGIRGLGQTNVEEMILSTIQSGKQDVLILGGEPFLQPEKLLQYVRGIRSFVRNIYITTSLPNQLDPQSETILKIFDLIDGLNVSVHHHDYVRNNEVLIATSGHDRIEQLEDILSTKAMRDKVRVCVNLVSGGIDSRGSLSVFARTMYSIGCHSLKINELQRVDVQTYVSFEDIWGVKLPSPYAHGCQTEIGFLFPEFKNMKIVLKRSCFQVQPEGRQKVTIQDVVKLFINEKLFRPKGMMKVLYENGSLSDGWKQK